MALACYKNNFIKLQDNLSIFNNLETFLNYLLGLVEIALFIEVYWNPGQFPRAYFQTWPSGHPVLVSKVPKHIKNVASSLWYDACVLLDCYCIINFHKDKFFKKILKNFHHLLGFILLNLLPFPCLWKF